LLQKKQDLRRPGPLGALRFLLPPSLRSRSDFGAGKSFSLERDVVVRALEVGVGTCRRARGHELVAAAELTLAAAVEELHRLRDDFDLRTLGAVLRFPGRPVEPAVDADP